MITFINLEISDDCSFLLIDRRGEKSFCEFKLNRLGFGGGEKVFRALEIVSNLGLRCLLIVIVTLNKLEVFESVEKFELKLRSDLRDEAVDKQEISLSF